MAKRSPLAGLLICQRLKLIPLFILSEACWKSILRHENLQHSCYSTSGSLKVACFHKLESSNTQPFIFGFVIIRRILGRHRFKRAPCQE